MPLYRRIFAALRTKNRRNRGDPLIVDRRKTARENTHKSCNNYLDDAIDGAMDEITNGAVEAHSSVTTTATADADTTIVFGADVSDVSDTADTFDISSDEDWAAIVAKILGPDPEYGPPPDPTFYWSQVSERKKGESGDAYNIRADEEIGALIICSDEKRTIHEACKIIRQEIEAKYKDEHDAESRLAAMAEFQKRVDDLDLDDAEDMIFDRAGRRAAARIARLERQIRKQQSQLKCD